jgi:hypothetical protein
MSVYFPPIINGDFAINTGNAEGINKAINTEITDAAYKLQFICSIVGVSCITDVSAMFTVGVENL